MLCATTATLLGTPLARLRLAVRAVRAVVCAGVTCDGTIEAARLCPCACGRGRACGACASAPSCVCACAPHRRPPAPPAVQCECSAHVHHLHAFLSRSITAAMVLLSFTGVRTTAGALTTGAGILKHMPHWHNVPVAYWVWEAYVARAAASALRACAARLSSTRCQFQRMRRMFPSKP